MTRKKRAFPWHFHRFPGALRAPQGDEVARPGAMTGDKGCGSRVTKPSAACGGCSEAEESTERENFERQRERRPLRLRTVTSLVQGTNRR